MLVAEVRGSFVKWRLISYFLPKPAAYTAASTYSFQRTTMRCCTWRMTQSVRSTDTGMVSFDRLIASSSSWLPDFRRCGNVPWTNGIHRLQTRLRQITVYRRIWIVTFSGSNAPPQLLDFDPDFYNQLLPSISSRFSFWMPYLISTQTHLLFHPDKTRRSLNKFETIRNKIE